MSRYYAHLDQFGESYVLTSDNNNFTTNLEIGQVVDIMLAPKEIEEAPETIDNTSSPKPPAWEEIREELAEWYLNYETTASCSVYAIGRKVHEIIVRKIGR